MSRDYPSKRRWSQVYNSQNYVCIESELPAEVAKRAIPLCAAESQPAGDATLATNAQQPSLAAPILQLAPTEEVVKIAVRFLNEPVGTWTQGEGVRLAKELIHLAAGRDRAVTLAEPVNRQSATLVPAAPDPQKPWPFSDEEMADIIGSQRFRLEARCDASESFAIGRIFGTELIALLRECERRLSALAACGKAQRSRRSESSSE